MPTSHDNHRGPRPSESWKVREVCFIPLDPVLDAFHGVVVEFYERDPGSSRPYVVLQSAALTGNVITRITSTDEATAKKSTLTCARAAFIPPPKSGAPCA